MLKTVPSAYEMYRDWYNAPLTLSKLERRFGHITTTELSVFISILAYLSPGPIVEFGTFTGRNAYNMALNTRQSIYTIDSGIPDHEGYGAYTPGEDFLTADLANRPHLILGDSRTVTIPVEPHTAGLVFVDGGHDYEVVKSDSARAFDLIRPDGVIIWDDYHGTWPGVIKAIDELAETVPLLLIQQECLVAWGLTETKNSRSE